MLLGAPSEDYSPVLLTYFLFITVYVCMYVCHKGMLLLLRLQPTKAVAAMDPSLLFPTIFYPGEGA